MLSAKKIVVSLIELYRRSNSVFIYRLSRSCIYKPTCSAYALEAIDKFGLWKGGKLALNRLKRCNGLKYESGLDPVPNEITKE